jgi:hypothetical protein
VNVLTGSRATAVTTSSRSSSCGPGGFT